MSGHSSVFARKDAALVGHVLAEQIGVLEVQRVGSEINFGFRARSTVFRGALAALVFIFMSFAGHNKLFNFAMNGVAAQRGVVFLHFEFFRLQLFVAAGAVAGGRFALLARLGAFNGDDFAGHKFYSFSFDLLLLSST